jgi:hypothetical protein
MATRPVETQETRLSARPEDLDLPSASERLASIVEVQRAAGYAGWKKAVKRTLRWFEVEEKAAP